ncbi:MAG: sulfite exporter TauE/SafE family protein [Actinomycetales bacterium]
MDLLHLHVLFLDVSLAASGLVVGLIVGLTGMGGGALLTPLLVLVFGVPPLAAVSSDLVTSLVMKPVGAVVHLRHGSVERELVRWLACGSVPAACAGALLAGALLRGPTQQSLLKLGIGVLLLASLAATVARLALQRRRGDTAPHDGGDQLLPLPGRTIAIGAVGGLLVGLTSVGAGSLIIAMLAVAYPRASPGRLVGTDIVQAIPLVGAAALGHLLVGDVHLTVTASLLVGALPGVYLGAQLSTGAPARAVRPLVAAVLAASALALLQTPPAWVIPAAVAVSLLVTYLGRTPPAATLLLSPDARR